MNLNLTIRFEGTALFRALEWLSKFAEGIIGRICANTAVPLSTTTKLLKVDEPEPDHSV